VSVLFSQIFILALWWHIIKAETCCTLDNEHCPYTVEIDGFVILVSVAPIGMGYLSLGSQGKKEQPFQRRSAWRKLVFVREAYVFQRKNVPLVISTQKGDSVPYNKRQELSVVTAVRFRKDSQVFFKSKLHKLQNVTAQV
jgi:hypothetical protein